MRKPLEFGLLVWLLNLLALQPASAESERKVVAASAPRLALVIGNAAYSKLAALIIPAVTHN